MRFIRHFIMTGLCAIALLACGSAQSACDLLSRSEIEQAAHAAVLDVRSLMHTPNLSVCAFDIRGGGRIWMLLRNDGRGDWIAAQTRRMSQEAGAGRMQRVGRLGDNAFLLGVGPAGAALCVFRRVQFFQVSAMRMDDAPGIAETIARRVVR